MELSDKENTVLQREGCILLAVFLTILGERTTSILCLLLLEIILI